MSKYYSYKDYVIGITNQGKAFIVDKEDYLLVKYFAWYIDRDGYVLSSIKGGTVKLHHLVLGYTIDNDKDIVVDHKNHVTSDNRKSNLRVCNNFQNAMNHKLSIRNKTGYAGVSKTAKGKYRASITANGKCMHLGQYDNLEDAVMARKRAEEQYHGEFAYKGEGIKVRAFIEKVERKYKDNYMQPSSAELYLEYLLDGERPWEKVRNFNRRY